MKLKIWLDSGANADSKYEQEIDLSDVGISDAEWAGMSDDGKDEAIKPIAWERMEWGYAELTPNI